MTKRKNPKFWDADWLEKEYETKSVQQIHEETGYAVRTIQRQLRRTGTPIRLGDHAPDDRDPYCGTLDPRVYDRMWLRARYTVRTQRQIAEELGCSVTTVRRWMRRFGIVPTKQEPDNKNIYKPTRCAQWRVTPEMAERLHLDSTEGKHMI